MTQTKDKLKMILVEAIDVGEMYISEDADTITFLTIKMTKPINREKAAELVLRWNSQPELLAACEKAHWLFNLMVKKGYLNADATIINILEAAIAKAKP